MDLRQLRYVVAVASRRSFTRAAEDLGIAQPALSQQVAALERELGVRLFDRTNRRVAPTQAGLALSVRAERILEDAAAAAREVGAHAGGHRGRVAVGTCRSFADFTLPKILGEFHRRYPEIEVSLEEGSAADLLARLRSGAIDVLAGELSGDGPTHIGNDLQEEALFEDDLVVATAPSHPFASRGTVEIADLRNEAFIVLGGYSRDRLSQLAAAGGFVPRIFCAPYDSLTVRSLVAENLGVALFPRSLGNTPGPRIAMLAVAPQKLMHRTSLVTANATLRPAAQSLLDVIRELTL
jgi:DNA-binding transcriptional LysR family regulator